MPLPGLLHLLDRPLQLLNDAPVDLPARHRTMRSASGLRAADRVWAAHARPRDERRRHDVHIDRLGERQRSTGDRRHRQRSPGGHPGRWAAGPPHPRVHELREPLGLLFGYFSMFQEGDLTDEQRAAAVTVRVRRVGCHGGLVPSQGDRRSQGHRVPARGRAPVVAGWGCAAPWSQACAVSRCPTGRWIRTSRQTCRSPSTFIKPDGSSGCFRSSPAWFAQSTHEQTVRQVNCDKTVKQYGHTVRTSVKGVAPMRSGSNRVVVYVTHGPVQWELGHTSVHSHAHIAQESSLPYCGNPRIARGWRPRPCQSLDVLVDQRSTSRDWSRSSAG
jgi:hypothetical protein